MDIDRTVQLTRDTSLKIKLLCRKIKCLNALKSHESIESVLQDARSMLVEIVDEANRKLLEDLINKTKLALNKPLKLKAAPKNRTAEMLKALYKKHKVDDFSAVDIQCNEKYGRHLISKRDFKPGEVIFVEKPYTQFLGVKRLHTHCSYCFKTTWANIPCEHCSWTMLCSEECRNEAWEKYHDLECCIYGCAKVADGNDVNKQLAIRILILAMREAGGIENLESELQAFDQDLGAEDNLFFELA